MQILDEKNWKHKASRAPITCLEIIKRFFCSEFQRRRRVLFFWDQITKEPIKSIKNFFFISSLFFIFPKMRFKLKPPALPLSTAAAVVLRRMFSFFFTFWQGESAFFFACDALRLLHVLDFNKKGAQKNHRKKWCSNINTWHVEKILKKKRSPRQTIRMKFHILSQYSFYDDHEFIFIIERWFIFKLNWLCIKLKFTKSIQVIYGKVRILNF